MVDAPQDNPQHKPAKLIDRVPCPACGAEVGKKCRTIINGVDMQWDHDARILLDGGLRVRP